LGNPGAFFLSWFVGEAAPRQAGNRGESGLSACLGLHLRLRVYPSVIYNEYVSIRAPRLLTGRLHEDTSVRLTEPFQSAPRDCSRGDVVMRIMPLRGRCFNPRPAIAHGATPGWITSLRLIKVSIRAPRLLTGRPWRSPRTNASRSFNPRPAIAHGATRCNQQTG